MEPKKPRPDEKTQSTSGEKIVVSSGSSRGQFVPAGEESPTAVDIGSKLSASNLESSSAESPTLADLGTSPAATAADVASSQSYSAQFVLIPGMLLAGRYEILEVLGEGGMGAVYKAKDRELDRFVALKVIRPELASNPDILQRFKQEILLSSKVTHRNVVRIYDLGDADGLKFITMEYVDAKDLRQTLRHQGRLGVNEAVDIIAQVFSGLAAAHREGIVHRDLKPGNIMQDATGRVVVMDFGLARTIASDGMTRTGMMVGTMEYMSPEQAQAKDLDARSDIFTVGLIFYELLTGKMPYEADSAVASLLKRSRDKAAPVSSHNAAIPRSLSSIVAKCLELEPELRYQSAAEALAALENWQEKGAAAALRFPDVRPWARDIPWHLVGVVTTVLVLAVTGFLFRNKLFGPKTTAVSGPISVLVADFTNYTGDPVFDGTLEPMVNTALEGASFINSYNRGSARKLAQKLPHPTDKLDQQSARLVAISQALSAVITGEISLHGDQYTVSATALDAISGKVIAQAEVGTANKNALVGEIPKLAAPIRRALGDHTPESAQVESERGAFTAASIETVHQFSLGLEQALAGNFQEATPYLEKATQLDPNFARAYSGLAVMAFSLGQQQRAQQEIKLAMEHVDRMTEREKYRIRGLYYQYTGEFQKSIESNKEFVARYPAEIPGRYNLASSYLSLHDFSHALEEARHVAEMEPKKALNRQFLSFCSSYAGDFQTAEQEAQAAIRLSPSSAINYLALTEAQLGQGQLSQAAEAYHKLEKLSPAGASVAAAGLADLAVHQGRFADAVRILEEGAAADLAAKNPDSAADKFAALGHTLLLRGQNRAAVAATEKALANSKSIYVQFLAGRNFAEAGELAKAQKLATALGHEPTAEPQAYAKIVEGDMALKRGEARKAIKAFTEANNLLDTWIARFDLARAYLEAGAFVEADAELDQCLKRRGEALELLFNNVPTYGYYPPVYYLQGRVREGLKSPGFSESYRDYLSIRGASGEDPRVPEIRRRLGQ
jgi:Flp pilus assembly protein TadD